MTISVTVPTLSKPKNTKDAIISILSKEWPLSARKIFTRVKKFGFDVSYQGVHKSIIELCENNVLSKEDKDYKINSEWVARMKDFADSISYRFSDIPIGECMIFNSLKEMDTFIMSMIEKLTRTGKMAVNCSHWRHAWWPIFASMKEYSVLREIAESGESDKIFITCRGESPVDAWCRKIYSGMGMNFRTGTDLENNFDFMVHGDLVIQMYWPRELIGIFEKAFASKKVEEMDVESLYKNVFEREAKICLVVINNHDIAELYREMVLSKFRS